MCDDKSPVLPLRDLHQMCDGRPPEPKGDHSIVSQKGSNYFLRIDPNISSEFLWWFHNITFFLLIYIYILKYFYDGHYDQKWIYNDTKEVNFYFLFL